jgi:hypothetical protein
LAEDGSASVGVTSMVYVQDVNLAALVVDAISDPRGC